MLGFQIDAHWVTAAQYISAGIGIGFGALGAGFGEGHTAREACVAIARQPRQQQEILKNMLVGEAVAETPSIFALVMGFLLALNFALPAHSATELGYLAKICAMIGCGIAVGVGGIGTGIGAGFISGTACQGIARQPEVGNRMMLTMLITQALATSPSIFGFVIALLLFYADGNTLPQAFAFLGAGIAMGFGSLGAAIGIGFVGNKTCEFLAKNVKSASAVTKTMFIGVAVTESNSVYALVVALLLLYSK